MEPDHELRMHKIKTISMKLVPMVRDKVQSCQDDQIFCFAMEAQRGSVSLEFVLEICFSVSGSPHLQLSNSNLATLSTLPISYRFRRNLIPFERLKFVNNARSFGACPRSLLNVCQLQATNATVNSQLFIQDRVLGVELPRLDLYFKPQSYTFDLGFNLHRLNS
jgi:hypothetical protein